MCLHPWLKEYAGKYLVTEWGSVHMALSAAVEWYIYFLKADKGAAQKLQDFEFCVCNEKCSVYQLKITGLFVQCSFFKMIES